MKLSVPKLLVLAAAMAALASAASPPNQMSWSDLNSQLETRAGESQEASQRVFESKSEAALHEARTNVANTMNDLFHNVFADINEGETVEGIFPKTIGAVSGAAEILKKAIRSTPDCPEGVQALVTDLEGLEAAHKQVSEHWDEYQGHLHSPEFTESRPALDAAKSVEEALVQQVHNLDQNLQRVKSEAQQKDNALGWANAYLQMHTFLTTDQNKDELIQAIDDNNQKLSPQQLQAAKTAVSYGVRPDDGERQAIEASLASDTPGAYQADFIKGKINALHDADRGDLENSIRVLEQELEALNSRDIPGLQGDLNQARNALEEAKERSEELQEGDEGHHIEIKAEFDELSDRLDEEKKLFAALNEKCQSPAVNDVINQTPSLYEARGIFEGDRDLYLEFADAVENHEEGPVSLARQGKLGELRRAKSELPRDLGDIEAEIATREGELQDIQRQEQTLKQEASERLASTAAMAAAAGL